MSAPFAGFILASVFLCCSLVAGCGSASEREAGAASVETLDGDTRMRRLLEAIRVRAAVDHAFLGTRGLRQAEAALARTLPSGKPEQLIQAHGQLAEELLRAGRAQEAVHEMQRVISLLPEASVPPELLQHVHYRMAVAALRMGETANCVHCLNGESCLLPVRREGRHTDPEGSRLAIEHLRRVLDAEPDHLAARWLLNVAHMTLGTYPDSVPVEFLIPPDAFTDAAADVPEFRNISHALGMDTFNPAGSVVIDDFDGDHDLDILTSTWDPAGGLRLFRRTEDGRYHEETGLAGLTGLSGGLNLVQADYDNDGDVDVLVLRGAWLEQKGRHPNSLLQNDGKGRFRDVTFEAGLGQVHYPTQTAAWSDYDNDGDLDLYIGNEMYPCQLFQNQGDGRFADVAAAAGVQNLRLAKAVVWGDYNQDRWPDIYVSNLPGDNRLYHNNRDGTFTDAAAELHLTEPHFSFPAWFWDYNNDGLLDLYVAGYEPSIEAVAADALGLPPRGATARLYRGTPARTFEEVSDACGLTAPAQPMGANFGDINNDGFPDFYLGTGFVDYEGLMPNLLYVNRNGIQFDNATFSARLGHLQKGHGIAFADLDDDGDQDIFAQLGGWFAGDSFANAVFENHSAPLNWLNVRLIGQQSNRSAIGARLKLVISIDDEPRAIYRWVNSGGSFGANPLRQHFGLSTATCVSSLEVYWPTSDTTQYFRDIDVNQSIEITEDTPQYHVVTLKPTRFPAAAAEDSAP